MKLSDNMYQKKSNELNSYSSYRAYRDYRAYKARSKVRDDLLNFFDKEVEGFVTDLDDGAVTSQDVKVEINDWVDHLDGAIEQLEEHQSSDDVINVIQKTRDKLSQETKKRDAQIASELEPQKRNRFITNLLNIIKPLETLVQQPQSFIEGERQESTYIERQASHLNERQAEQRKITHNVKPSIPKPKREVHQVVFRDTELVRNKEDLQKELLQNTRQNLDEELKKRLEEQDQRLKQETRTTNVTKYEMEEAVKGVLANFLAENNQLYENSVELISNIENLSHSINNNILIVQRDLDKLTRGNNKETISKINLSVVKRIIPEINALVDLIQNANSTLTNNLNSDLNDLIDINNNLIKALNTASEYIETINNDIINKDTPVFSQDFYDSIDKLPGHINQALSILNNSRGNGLSNSLDSIKEKISGNSNNINKLIKNIEKELKKKLSGILDKNDSVLIASVLIKSSSDVIGSSSKSFKNDLALKGMLNLIWPDRLPQQIERLFNQ